MIYLFVALLSIIASAIEAVSYSGYIMGHSGINPVIIYFVSLILSHWAPITPKSFHPLLRTSILAVAGVFSIIIFAENVMYPNYIYSHIHVNPSTLALLVGLSLFHLIRLQQTSIIRSLLVACLIYVGTSGGGKTLAIITSNMITIARDPFATYESKMTKAYPGFYPIMMTVKRLTAEDATILIPPQGNPWEIEGNSAMVTYFLYPRKVHNLDPKSIASLGDNTYVLISKGSWKRSGEVDYGWPKVKVKATKLWEIDQNGHIVDTFADDYDPQIHTWDWGLIEVNYE